MSISPSEPNPYSSPQAFSDLGVQQAQPAHPKMPVFCKVMFIVSLVFCSLRAAMVPFSILGYEMLSRQNEEIALTVGFEIVAGVGIAVFGILGNCLLLARKDWAIVLGYLTAISVVGSIIVGLWQAAIMSGDIQAGSPEQIGFFIGSAFTLIVRLVLLSLFVAALVKYSSWARHNSQVGQALRA